MMRGYRGDRLHVVDHRRTGVEARDGGEWGPQPRLAPPALQRVQQRGLLAADVGAGTRVHDDLQVVAGAQDVGAGVPGRVRLPDRLLQTAYHMQHLASDVNECVIGADRVRGDDHSLDQGVRGGHHQRDVLAGPGLGFIGVDHEVLGLRVVLRDEAPLHPGRKARSAAAAQAGVLHEGHDVCRFHLQRRPQAAISATELIVGELPGALVSPVSREHRGQKAMC